MDHRNRCFPIKNGGSFHSFLLTFTRPGLMGISMGIFQGQLGCLFRPRRGQGRDHFQLGAMKHPWFFIVKEMEWPPLWYMISWYSFMVHVFFARKMKSFHGFVGSSSFLLLDPLGIKHGMPDNHPLMSMIFPQQKCPHGGFLPCLTKGSAWTKA